MPSMTAITFNNRIDILNILLIIFAWLCAMGLPFETLLIAYGFIGPAHYLTQISWMHDRDYFTGGKYDFLPILALSISVFVFIHYYIPIMMLMVSYAIAIAFFKQWPARIKALLAITAVLGVAHLFSFGSGLYLILTTFIHVGIFTSMFMLSGALKNKSFWGFAAVALLYVLGALALLLPLDDYIPSAYAGQNMKYLGDIVQNLATIFDYTGSEGKLITAGRFAAFLYLYHYLNWFSKTGVIGWHKMSKERFKVIVLLYIGSVGIYFMDYGLGFKVLLFLSFLHVALEFPLNALSAKDIAGHLFVRKAIKE